MTSHRLGIPPAVAAVSRAFALLEGNPTVPDAAFRPGDAGRLVTGLRRQVRLTGLGAAAALTAVLLLGTSGGPQARDSVELFALLAYALLIVSAVLVLRVLVLIHQNDQA